MNSQYQEYFKEDVKTVCGLMTRCFGISPAVGLAPSGAGEGSASHGSLCSLQSLQPPLVSFFPETAHTIPSPSQMRTLSSPPSIPRASAAGSGDNLVTQPRDLPALTWQPPGLPGAQQMVLRVQMRKSN